MVIQFVGTLLGIDAALRKQALSEPEERRRGLAEHTAIGEAILAGDPELAERLMREHVLRAGAHTMSIQQAAIDRPDGRELA